MPYIKRDARPWVDCSLDDLIADLRSNPPANADGELNYSISRLVSEVLGPEKGPWRYVDIARAVAVFECAKLEFYRRVAAPKEDRAMSENGDIPAYEGPE